MASPRTGAGAYTAMSDAVMLGAALQRGKPLEEALQIYNDDTVKRGQQLFQRSRQAASHFTPSGWKPVSPAKLLEDALLRRKAEEAKSEKGLIKQFQGCFR
ncbi:unnamed protein product [Polarella glacialis]|uniref:FAD-binding domain-containing protein n=1 Tax=Polarella glacialis TaxID=89957 RepID=A0A813IJL9_POLGL|nr:unnamed protein product [Polarella glacialis]